MDADENVNVRITQIISILALPPSSRAADLWRIDMKSVVKLSIAVLVCVGSGAFAVAADKGSAGEAKALLEKATVHLKTAGTERALSDFSNDKAAFTDRDLYLFCFGPADGKWTAHGANKGLIGRDFMQVKDAAGKQIGAEMIEIVKNKGEGWVDYMWQNPESKKIEAKSSLVRLIGDQVCGVGIYK